MKCVRCGDPRPSETTLLFCSCGKLWDRNDLKNIVLAPVPGSSLRVERFLQTGDPNYTDSRIPITVTDRQQEAS